MDIKLLRHHHPVKCRRFANATAIPDYLKVELARRVHEIKYTHERFAVKVERLRNAGHLMEEHCIADRRIFEVTPQEISCLEERRLHLLHPVWRRNVHTALVGAFFHAYALAVRLVSAGVSAHHLQRKDIAMRICVDNFRHYRRKSPIMART